MSDYHCSAQFFRALGHPVRLQILDLLRHGPMCVCHIEEAVGKRQAYVSQQLMVLREAGLVETERKGVLISYRLSNATLTGVLAKVLGPQPKPINIIITPCEITPENESLINLESTN